MQVITGKVHGLRRFRFVEPGENVFNSLNQVWPYSAAIAAFVKPFETAMLKTPNR